MSIRYSISKATVPTISNLGQGAESIKIRLSQVSKDIYAYSFWCFSRTWHSLGLCRIFTFQPHLEDFLQTDGQSSDSLSTLEPELPQALRKKKNPTRIGKRSGYGNCTYERAAIVHAPTLHVHPLPPNNSHPSQLRMSSNFSYQFILLSLNSSLFPLTFLIKKREKHDIAFKILQSLYCL